MKPTPESIQLAEVIVVVDAFFDVLSRFEGATHEVALIRTLVDRDAQIVEEGPALSRRPGGAVYRDVWLGRLTTAALIRRAAAEARLVQEVARRSRGSSNQWLIHSVVEERCSRHGRTSRTAATRWSLLIRRLDGTIRIAHVRMRHDAEDAITSSA